MSPTHPLPLHSPYAKNEVLKNPTQGTLKRELQAAVLINTTYGLLLGFVSAWGFQFVLFLISINLL